MAEGKINWVEEYGFELSNSGYRTVECIICGRHGAGFTGRGQALLVMIYRNWSGYWQRACAHPHTYGCACGLFFPSSVALGGHAAQHRRRRNEGHGRMDQVGWSKWVELR